MKTRFLVASFVLSSILSLSAGAQSLPNIDHRQANQEQRIDQGIHSGQLTPREVQKLDHGQAHVDHLEHRAKADGVVTAAERHRIARAQNRQGRKIARAKHNRRHDFNHNGAVDRF